MAIPLTLAGEKSSIRTVAVDPLAKFNRASRGYLNPEDAALIGEAHEPSLSLQNRINTAPQDTSGGYPTNSTAPLEITSPSNTFGNNMQMRLLFETIFLAPLLQ